MKKKIIYMVMVCTLLLVAGCKDHGEEINVVPDSQDSSKIASRFDHGLREYLFERRPLEGV